MVASGVELMVVGMATVFAFLGLLVLMMHVSARVVAALQPKPQTAPALAADDDAEIAIVLAAVAAARQAAAKQAAAGRRE